jgi:hypothetical protein
VRAAGCGQDSAGNFCSAYVPPGTGTVDVQLTTSEGFKTPITQSGRFTYQGVTISSISPAEGAITGGTFVQLRGAGFYTWTPIGTKGMQVLFESVPAASVWCESSTTCTVQAPALANPGSVHITANAFGTVSTPTASDVFTYVAVPKIVRLWGGGSSSPAPGGVELDSFAAAGGATIALTSSDPGVMVPPATVTIPAGSRMANFGLSVPSGANGRATLTATYNGQSVSTNVVVTPPAPTVCPAKPCGPHHEWDSHLCQCVGSNSGCTPTQAAAHHCD